MTGISLCKGCVTWALSWLHSSLFYSSFSVLLSTLRPKTYWWLSKTNQLRPWTSMRLIKSIKRRNLRNILKVPKKLKKISRRYQHRYGTAEDNTWKLKRRSLKVRVLKNIQVADSTRTVGGRKKKIWKTRTVMWSDWTLWRSLNLHHSQRLSLKRIALNALSAKRVASTIATFACVQWWRHRNSQSLICR